MITLYGFGRIFPEGSVRRTTFGRSGRSRRPGCRIDEMSLMYLVGTEIDDVEGLQGAGACARGKA
jgi:hypothetical protein